MLSDKRLVVIGAGMMGGALASGLVRAGALASAHITLYDAFPDASRRLAAALGAGAAIAASAPEAVAGADLVLLAVKPHVVLPVLPTLGLTPAHLLLSIAAGVPLAKMEAALTEDVPVIRAMPNTPALVGQGATALSRGRHATEEHAALARELFSAVGEVVTVEERLMDAVTGLSGSGPAYVYLIIEALADGGVKAGLPRDVARRLAAQTVRGAAEMVISSGEHPAQLKDGVTTPGGTLPGTVRRLRPGRTPSPASPSHIPASPRTPASPNSVKPWVDKRECSGYSAD
jgi:pyrroline-5-carboxylate reductase